MNTTFVVHSLSSVPYAISACFSPKEIVFLGMHFAHLVTFVLKIVVTGDW